MINSCHTKASPWKCGACLSSHFEESGASLSSHSEGGRGGGAGCSLLFVTELFGNSNEESPTLKSFQGERNYSSGLQKLLVGYLARIESQYGFTMQYAEKVKK